MNWQEFEQVKHAHALGVSDPGDECGCEQCRKALAAVSVTSEMAPSKKTEAEDAPGEAVHHPKGVLAWRESEFRRMGFKPMTADWLAKTRIDLHMMRDLLDQGCEHLLAIRILEGTTYFGEDPNPYYRPAPPRSAKENK